MAPRAGGGGGGGEQLLNAPAPCQAEHQVQHRSVASMQAASLYHACLQYTAQEIRCLSSAWPECQYCIGHAIVLLPGMYEED